uniref:Coiled-coil domain-containing protein 86 n=1 Tax=Steinernema glaseri TaxID=37863 RepID=A0A1I8A609_9BILA
MSNEDVAPMLQPVESEERGMPKSGRWWKSVNKQRHTAIFKDKPLKSSWETKMKKKADQQAVKLLQEQIRTKIAEEKAAKIEARKEQEQRRQENERKGEIVQVITNTAKLKKTKKKQLRSIQKRDTN